MKVLEFYRLLVRREWSFDLSFFSVFQSLFFKLCPSGKSASALRRLQRKRKLFEDLYLHQAFAEAFNEEFETWNKLFWYYRCWYFVGPKEFLLGSFKNNCLNLFHTSSFLKCSQSNEETFIALCPNKKFHTLSFPLGLGILTWRNILPTSSLKN